jgi:hypothetical protein
MMERLYVDNKLVDVGKDVGITMSIVSNLFSDVSKLKGNASYTIKLPKTAVNMSVFGYADRVDARTTMAYRKHVARFYRNGVEIFKDADCVLQSASDEGYEVVIVWGCRPKFTDIIKQNMTLRDLQSDATLLFEETPTISTYDGFMSQGYGYLRMITRWESKEEPKEWHGRNDSGEYGVGWQKITHVGKETSGATDITPRRIFIAFNNNHPCVSVKWILERILADMGVEFRWTGDAKTMVESLAIPCVTKEANELTYTGKMVAQWVSQPSGGYGRKMVMAVIASDTVFGNLNTETDTLTVLTDCDLMVKADISIKHNWDSVFEYVEGYGTEEEHSFAYRDFFKAAEVIIEVKHGDSSTDEYRIGNAENFFVGDLYDRHDVGLVEVLSSSGIISVEQGDEISVKLISTGDQSYRAWVISGGMSAMAVDGSDVPFNGQFPIVENLPDIKVVDFVKFLCAVTGTFPLQKSSGNVVEFAEFDVLQRNIVNAVDWTNRVRAKTTSNVPQRIGYKMDGWAKRNHYKWKEDETTHGGYDGYLTIDDDTLDEERDVITFPFAASDMDYGVALVPLYERKYEYDDNGALIEPPTYEYGRTEPRIVEVTGMGSGKAGTRFKMEMQGIIAKKYGLISGCLANAKVIEESVELTDREIAEFDETIPVWLAQYGSYFAVLEIKMNGDGLSDVKMIRIKNEYQPYCSVKATLTNIIANVPSSVMEDDELSIVLTLQTGYMVSSVVVTMGGQTISAYDSATQTIYIEHVTGNVSITASAVEVIVFEDAAVKAICVNNWGGGVIPGEITPAEAAAVTTLSNKFYGNTSITKFNELRYFTGLTTLYYTTVSSYSAGAFYNCSALTEITMPAAPITNLNGAFRGSAIKNIDLTPITATSTSLGTTFRDSKVEVITLDAIKYTGNLYYTFRFANSTLAALHTIHANGADFSGATFQSNTFANCYKLATIDGTITGLKQNLTMSQSSRLTRASLLVIINGLHDFIGAGSSTRRTLTLHATAKARLTEDDIAIAEAKGWTIA